MKKIFLLLCGLWAATGSYAQDSLAISTFTMYGDIRERGMMGLRLDNGQSAVFNLTSNCNTAQCAHGMAGIRIDKHGHMLHYKKFGHLSLDVDPNEAIWTSDKHILLVGQHGSDRILMKVDTMFSVVWARQVLERPQYTTSATDALVEVNGSYYSSFNNTLTKVRADGSVVFSKIYGPEEGVNDAYSSLNITSLVPIAADRFFIAGSVDLDNNNIGPYEDAFVAIIDTNGTILKQKKFDVGAPYGSEISYAFKQSANRMRVFGHHWNDVYTAEVDTNLAVTNAKNIVGDNAYTHTVHYNGEDQYILGFNYGGITLMAIDNNGNTQWSRSYGGGFSAFSIYSMNDCTYGLYASCGAGQPNWKKGYWMTVNEDGQSAAPQLEAAFTPDVTNLTITMGVPTAVDSGQWQTDFTIQNFLFDSSPVGDSSWSRSVNQAVCPEVPQHVTEVSTNAQKELCSPNPFYGQIEIGNDWELNKIAHLVVYDITGRVILSEAHPTSRTITLDGIAKGVVFVRWTYEGQVYTQKMVGL